MSISIQNEGMRLGLALAVVSEPGVVACTGIPPSHDEIKRTKVAHEGTPVQVHYLFADKLLVTALEDAGRLPDPALPNN
jgi:hypothetical protein